jgi:CheY-like chemotaxis protein
MPIMDGWEVVRRIRQDEKLKAIAVIALTAHAMAGDREKMLAAGFDNHIAKPLIPSEFIGNLLSALGNHPTFRTLS